MCAIGVSGVLREMRLIILAVLTLWPVSIRSVSVMSMGSVRPRTTLATIGRLHCPLDPVDDSAERTLQAVAILDMVSGVSVPAKSFGKTVLLRADHV